jgi:hypothetical protein
VQLSFLSSERHRAELELTPDQARYIAYLMVRGADLLDGKVVAVDEKGYEVIAAPNDWSDVHAENMRRIEGGEPIRPAVRTIGRDDPTRAKTRFSRSLNFRVFQHYRRQADTYSNSSGLPASNDGKAFRISVKCFRIAISALSGSRRSIASRIALCWSMSVIIDSVLFSVR